MAFHSWRLSDALTYLAANLSLAAGRITSGTLTSDRVSTAGDGELLRRSGTSTVGLATTTFANASHAHSGADVTTGTLPMARVLSSSTAGYTVRVNSTNDGLEAIATHAAGAAVTLTTSDQDLVSVVLPVGTHTLILKHALNPMAASTTRTMTHTFAFSGTATRIAGVLNRTTLGSAGTLTAGAVAGAILGTASSFAATHGNTTWSNWEITLTLSVTIAGTFTLQMKTDVSDGFIIRFPTIQVLTQ